MRDSHKDERLLIIREVEKTHIIDVVGFQSDMEKVTDCPGL